MNAWQLMMDAGNYLPDHVKYWTYWMQGILFLAPLLFIKHTAARLLILAQLLNTLVAYGVFIWEGNQVTKLFGVGHFLWLWPALYLYRDCRNTTSTQLYRGFALCALITIAISLVFDTRDTAQWLLGDRASVLVILPKD